MRSKWSDFLFTVAVRFCCGALLGVILSLLICAPISSRAARRPLLLWVFGDEAHPRRPYFWIGAWSLLGGMIGALTTPKWQTPWYKREPLNLRPDLASLLQDQPERGFHNVSIKKSITIKMTGADGQPQEYHSMEEVPPELRAQIQAVANEALRAKGDEASVTDTQKAGDRLTIKNTRTKSASIYRIVDASGVERTYHSLEELPPEIRTAILAERQNRKGAE